MRALSLLEGRVLGVLIEKAHTVPDSYPLSLNSLTLGCNQKTARDPVLNATEAEVQDAVLALKALHLVAEASGSRVTRYEHNAARVLARRTREPRVLRVELAALGQKGRKWPKTPWKTQGGHIGRLGPSWAALGHLEFFKAFSRIRSPVGRFRVAG